MFDYTKSILERVSFDPILFCKRVRKAIRILLPYELEQLRMVVWFYNWETRIKTMLIDSRAINTVRESVLVPFLI
jgi:hypothetical protein